MDLLKDKAPCWIVWKRAPDAETGGRPYLVAVDMTKEQADLHKRCVEQEGGMAQIEESVVNHLYGETMTEGYMRVRSLAAEMRDRNRGG